ncbi:Zinc finger, RING/FYVE/PHD-type [Artemisia annua]|uniref:Zinc finger, RING/FYVE/PHD-type n=1 Tax=Artemisia annua TaxID=35608 RepID=A0A2U1ND05_ARTAN|nr:Zinc finger, RING/FYVE/PHD-type [Artemisia annua]
MSGSTPERLLEIRDGVPRLPHELLGIAFPVEVDHSEEESLIPVERLVTTNPIADGITSQGVEVINSANNAVNTNGVNNELNESRIVGCSCPICYDACTTEGNHQICNLPCGHVYGLSCIKKWLQLNQSSKKCPQCKRSCTLEDVRKLYVTCQHTDDNETLLKNVLSRMEELRVSTLELRDQETLLKNVFSCIEELRVSALGVPDHGDLKEKLSGSKKRIHAFEELVHAIDALKQRVSTGTAR